MTSDYQEPADSTTNHDDTTKLTQNSSSDDTTNHEKEHFRPKCLTCNRDFNKHGIAAHRAMHQKRSENCTIEFASGVVSYDFQ